MLKTSLKTFLSSTVKIIGTAREIIKPTSSQEADPKGEGEAKLEMLRLILHNQGMEDSIYGFKVKTIDGRETKLGEFKGSVLLIVNVASRCGFTPQYAGLEVLYKKYKDAGLAVLGFPCNQFGRQEPAGEKEIKSFCEQNFGVTFPMFSKIDVNGPTAHPLYKYLKNERRGILFTSAIKWNFTKFLVDRNGRVIKRFSPATKPYAISAEIEKLLK